MADSNMLLLVQKTSESNISYDEIFYASFESTSFKITRIILMNGTVYKIILCCDVIIYINQSQPTAGVLKSVWSFES
jgi:hypothetical protein